MRQMQSTHEVGIRVTGMNESYEALKSFTDLKFYGKVKRLMDDQNWKTPTRIQSHAIPIILKNKGLIGVSATGSGKTLAYVLPLTYLMEKIPNSKTLVLAPTRELSKQIANEFNKLMPKDVGCVYGGIAKYLQQKQIFKRVVVATPGRLIDFLRYNKLKFDFIVIDQVDRILEGNFIEQLDDIIKRIGEYQQMMMFTATVNKKVDELIRKYIKDPVRLTFEGSNSYNTNIQQEIIQLNNFRQKIDEMLQILREYRGYKILIFCNTKSKTNQLSDTIKTRMRQRSCYIHGDVPQERREQYVTEFREGRFNILVATDVASRGLDISNISLILNFDFPRDIQTYTHRIGRTARYNKKGTAISFVSREAPNLMYDLVEFMVKCKQKIPQQLIRLANYSQTRIDELEESLRGLQMPPDMPPAPPPPERKVEEEYVEKGSNLDDIFRVGPIPINRGGNDPRYQHKDNRENDKFQTRNHKSQSKQDQIEFKYMSKPTEVDTNETLTMSFQHHDIPIDVPESFLNLSFRKAQQQSFIEESRIYTDKNSILSEGKKSEKFDLNKYIPKSVCVSIRLGDSKMSIAYGKFLQHEAQLLVIGRYSPSYIKIKNLVQEYKVPAKSAELMNILNEVDNTINKEGLTIQSFQVMRNYTAVMFVNHIKIRKEYIWTYSFIVCRAIFERVIEDENDTVIVAIPLTGQNGEGQLQTEQQIEFILNHCATLTQKHQKIKHFKLLIENQQRCKKFIEVVMKSKLV